MKQEIVEILIYEFQKKVDIIDDRLKKLISLIFNFKENEAIDLILYCIVLSINNKNYKKLNFLYLYLKKFDIQFFKDFVNDIKNILVETFEKKLYLSYFLEILKEFDPLWLYNYLDKNKASFDNKILDFYNCLRKDIEEFNSIKKEIDNIIFKNFKDLSINYVNFDYFSFL
jgi:hypothetical protein